MVSFLDKLAGHASEERLGVEEATGKSIDKFRKNSEGSEKQFSETWLAEVPFLAGLLMLSKETKIPAIAEFCTNVLQLRVSTARAGRSELVDLLKHKLNSVEEAKRQLEQDQQQKTRLGG
jgi:hypothetical protein